MDLFFQYSIPVLLILTSLILTGMGLAGCIIPVVPGHPLILLGCIAASYAFPIAEHAIGWANWTVLSLLCIIGMLGDNICTYWGAKRFGSTAAGIWGSLTGLLIGGFFFPLGLLIGPFLGAISFEIGFQRREIKESMKSGFGAMLGTFGGILFKLGIAVLMIAWFLVASYWF